MASEAEDEDGQQEELAAQSAARGQRRVGRPAMVHPAHQPGGHQQDHRRHGDPVAERVQAREGHVRGPDHERDEVVAQRRYTHEVAGDHDHAVQRDQGVVGVAAPLGEELDALLGQLQAEGQGHGTADEQRQHRGDGILDADDLVVAVIVEVARPLRRMWIAVIGFAGLGAAHPGPPVGHGAGADHPADGPEDGGHSAPAFGSLRRAPDGPAQQGADRHGKGRATDGADDGAHGGPEESKSMDGHGSDLLSRAARTDGAPTPLWLRAGCRPWRT